MACERVLAKIGFKRMTMADVAEEAKLTRRTVYLHFASKEALVAATLTGVIERTKSAMQSGLEGCSGLEALRKMLNARILSRLERVGPFHHSLDDVFQALYPHSSNDYLSFFDPEAELLITAMERGFVDGSIKSVDPRLTAELLIRSTNGFLPSNLSLSEAAHPEQVRVKLSRLVEMLTYSLAAEAAR